MKIWLFLEGIIMSGNEEFENSESDRAVTIRRLGTHTRKAIESNDTVKQTTCS
jgi:hypothetical protein